MDYIDGTIAKVRELTQEANTRDKADRQVALDFLNTVVKPTLSNLSDRFNQHSIPATTEFEINSARLNIDEVQISLDVWISIDRKLNENRASALTPELHYMTTQSGVMPGSTPLSPIRFSPIQWPLAADAQAMYVDLIVTNVMKLYKAVWEATLSSNSDWDL